MRLQLESTLNVTPSWFNDWFTGHLNFQIEHHLIPTMPRHHYEKVRPLIQVRFHTFSSRVRHVSLTTIVRFSHVSLTSIGFTIQDLCEKHGIVYREKPLLAAMGDIVASMKVSGEMWLDAYHMDDTTELGEHEQSAAASASERSPSPSPSRKAKAS